MNKKEGENFFSPLIFLIVVIKNKKDMFNLEKKENV